MSNGPRRESPLVSHAGDAGAVSWTGAGVVLTERPFRALLNLRGDPGDVAFAPAVAAATGLALPGPNAFTAGGDLALAWLGPDEFLLIGAPGEERALADRLRARLSGVVSAVTDVTCGHTTLAIEGEGAREFLARGCPLDLHPREFRPGQCAQSHIAKTNVLLLQRDAKPTFEIVVKRSFADYLLHRLTQSGPARAVTASTD
jgi:sarcosine oxidase subunit gamma